VSTAPARRVREEARGPRAPLTASLIVVVALGGAAGTLLRAALADAHPAHGGAWPWTTFAVNLAGAALLGVVVTAVDEHVHPAPRLHGLLATGLCGALTTFSTIQVEALRLGRDGHAGLALAYVAASIAAGLLLVALATAATRALRSPR
jgi:CrcB protein